MRKIREVILVEGRYDKNTLLQTVDATVIECGGFAIFHNEEKVELLRRLAAERGLILLTDSDGAGFVIRNHLKGVLPKEGVRQAYIPDIAGKERRKRKAGKEGKLGVEGMRPEVLLEALSRAGATFEDGGMAVTEKKNPITKTDLYLWGLSEGPDALEKRRQLLRQLRLPEHLTANGLLEVLNLLSNREEVERLLKEMPES